MRLLIGILSFFSLNGFSQIQPEIEYEILEYMQLKSVDDTASIAEGTVGSGSLKHGKLMPYSGLNFSYFDKESYLAGRAFLHGSVKNAMLQSYDSLYQIMPKRRFRVMECANEEGGKMHPHKTHQNGMSIDLMMPLIQNNLPYYELDNIGAVHYLLSFDDKGNLKEDTSIQIDFNLVARQILLINHFAKLHGLLLSKVIIKIELKAELFKTEYGKILKNSDIYIVQGLSPRINDLHDDHFHLDFVQEYPKTLPAQNSQPILK